MLVNLFGGSYKNRYVSYNGQRCINWYPVLKTKETENSKSAFALFPTPGLSSFADTSQNTIKGLYTARSLQSERCFAVGYTATNPILYEINSDGTVTNRGSLTNMAGDTNPAYMALNGNSQLMISAYNPSTSSSSYILNIGTNTLSEITDVDFPGKVESLTYMDGYFIITSQGRVYFSAVNDGTSWVATDVFTPSSKADNASAVCSFRDDLYVFGGETIETYYNDGTTPFVKKPSSTVFIGLVNAQSFNVFHQGFFFLGKSPNGEIAPYFYSGNDCIQIPNSTAIVWQLNQATAPITDSYSALEYTKDGHIWWYLTIPALDTTYVYDYTTDEWHERQSKNPNSSSIVEFRGKYFTNFKGMNLWSDLYDGAVLKENFTVTTESGQTITRTVTSPIFNEESKNISVYELEIEANVGTGLTSTPASAPNLSLQWSTDGGNTFSTARSLSLGASGAYTTRVRTHKLGTGRNWVTKISLTDAADVALYRGIAHGVVGIS